MAGKMRITKSRCLALSTSLEHIEETLGEKAIFSGIDIDVTDCGVFPIYIHILGQIKVLSSKKQHEFCSAIHLSKDADDNWEPIFVDVQISMNGKHGPGVEMKMSSARFLDGKKFWNEDSFKKNQVMFQVFP